MRITLLIECSMKYMEGIYTLGNRKIFSSTNIKLKLISGNPQYRSVCQV